MPKMDLRSLLTIVLMLALAYGSLLVMSNLNLDQHDTEPMTVDTLQSTDSMIAPENATGLAPRLSRENGAPPQVRPTPSRRIFQR